MAEVDDSEDTEDHGQSQRGQRVEATEGQALERVLDEGGHGSSRVVGVVWPAVLGRYAARSRARAAYLSGVVVRGHILQAVFTGP
ncbi:hypothetical protein GCM10009845_21470 [Pedococcus bigeumensis]